ncbi:hypothetical protein C2E25_08635 [Geothermobacter hydrogeniphilus]|uniref:histidine kinase n=1 Tax=Geothermobacter hydrogeniphilus TaxID=1969733 RepID=A0A2K2HAE7_9BACT|nr:ATP-binding protein [Geothermobacter hydrogeniphilus]PNU20241.1 hypothetical protein C2E25_08635 [Geothermobacter hydrogeniphilus]
MRLSHKSFLAIMPLVLLIIGALSFLQLQLSTHSLNQQALRGMHSLLDLFFQQHLAPLQRQYPNGGTAGQEQALQAATDFLLPEGGRLLIFNRNGKLLLDTHPDDEKLHVDNHFRFLTSRGWNPAETIEFETSNPDDNDVFLTRQFPPWSWQVVLALKNRTLKAEKKQLLRISIGTTAAATLLLIIILTILTRKTLIRPIKKLRSRAGQIARGDFNHPAPLDSRDELGELAASMEQMAAQLDAQHRQLNRELQLRRSAEEDLRRLTVELEQRVMERTAALQRSNQDLEQFAYVASHDLQEPLRIITGYVQLLQRRYQGQLDADADEFIHFAVDAANRMKQLINDLLDYSRIDRKGDPFVEVDLNRVLDRALKNLELTIEENGARIESERLPNLVADPGQMERLLQNLIGNAIKFHGQNPPVIKVFSRREKDAWRILIQDNGIGIDTLYRERIFQVFQRLHGLAEYPGTGIGLAMCKKIAERHGGHIGVDSEPGNGACFWFVIPDRRNP